MVGISISSAGTITASGGTLDLTGTVTNRTLAINTTARSDLKIDGTVTAAAMTLNNSNQTLEVGASGNLTLTGAQTLANGKIQLDGGTLNDSSGLVIGSGAVLSGVGTVTAALSGTGTIKAGVGTLTLSGTVNPGLTLAMDTSGQSLSFLQITGQATVSNLINFSTDQQYLQIGNAGVLTLSAAQTMNVGSIYAYGGTINFSQGLTLNSTNVSVGRLLGFGTVNGSIAAVGGHIQAAGGFL